MNNKIKMRGAVIAVVFVAGVCALARGQSAPHPSFTKAEFESRQASGLDGLLQRFRQRLGLQPKAAAKPVLFDFGDGKAVPAHEHWQGGGWVADSASVGAGVSVGPGAVVYGTARVSGFVQLEDKAIVRGDARVSGSDVIISGDAVIDERALVYGSARIFGHAVVSGDAFVASSDPSWSVGGYGTPNLSGDALVHEHARVCGNAMVSGGEVGGTARLGRNAWVKWGKVVAGVILE